MHILTSTAISEAKKFDPTLIPMAEWTFLGKLQISPQEDKSRNKNIKWGLNLFGQLAKLIVLTNHWPHLAR